MTDKMTTIQVRVETKERLAKLGVMGDTYNAIIQRLLGKVSKKAILRLSLLWWQLLGWCYR